MEKVKCTIDSKEYYLNCLKNDKRVALIKNKKGTQKNKIKLFFKMCETLQPEIIIDIGFNYGEFLLPLTQTNKKVLAFEPNIDVFQCAKETFKNNNNIQMFNNSVLDKYEKSVNLYIPVSSGNASLNEKYLTSPTQNIQKTEQIDVKEVLKNYNNFLMKIDIEGMEYKILNEIAKIDEKFSSYCIFFENNRAFGPPKQDVENFLHNKIICPYNENTKNFKNLKFFKYQKNKDTKKILNSHDIFVFKGAWCDKIHD
jgi:FkbM family methyltransferase